MKFNPLIWLVVGPATLLQGTVSNEQGRIGIRTDWDRKIVRMAPESPAEKAGLQLKDKILTVDGDRKGEIVGPAYGTVRLKVQRGETIFTVDVKRLPNRQIQRYR